MSGVEVSVETRGATVDLGGRDLTPSDTAEFEVPTEAMVDLLMKLAEARS